MNIGVGSWWSGSLSNIFVGGAGDRVGVRSLEIKCVIACACVVRSLLRCRFWYSLLLLLLMYREAQDKEGNEIKHRLLRCV